MMPKKLKVEQVGGGDDATAAVGGKEDDLGVEADKQDKITTNDMPSTSGQHEQNETCDETGGLGVPGGSFNGHVSNEKGGRWNSDWTALLAIFPEEVWMIILESIPDADTLENTTNASPVFRQLLLPRRVQFLFPKVWNILGVKYNEAANDDNGDEAFQEPPNDTEVDDEDSSTPYWFTGIIKLRMVCRSSRDAIDNWYQNQPFRLTGSMSLDGNIINTLATDSFESESPEHLEIFSDHFKSTHCSDGVAIRNPFLGRSVRLNIDLTDRDVAEDDQFLNGLVDLFSKYGRHIWYLEICFVDPTRNEMEECYSIFRTLLQAAPNLKTVCVSFESGGATIADWDWLEPFIHAHPLPRLENLRLLATKPDSGSYVPKPIFRELIRTSGGGVSALEYDYRHYTIDDYNISSVTVPNLSQLSVTIWTDEEFETFFAADVQWRLSKLELELHLGTVSVEWDRIFRQVEFKWAETLTVLYITLPFVRGTKNLNRLEQEGGNFRLNLPRLSHLKLDMRNLCSLDFLLPLSNSLQDFDLDLNATVPSLGPSGIVERLENGKMIQLLASPHKPMDSNIWTLFRKLKRVMLDYRLWSAEKERKDTLWWVSTVWSVTRQQLQNWDNKSDAYRRNKLDMWEMKRIYH